MFTRTALNDVLQIDSIITLHYFDYTLHFQFSGEVHDFWEMVYIDHGDVTIVAENTTILLRKNQALFHKPNEFHSIRANDSYAGVVIITFDTQSPALEYLTHGPIELSSHDKRRISEILKEARATFSEPLDIVNQVTLIKRANAPFGAEQIIKNQIEQLLIHLIRQQMLENPLPQPAAEDNQMIAARIMKILEDNLCGNLSLDDISEQLSFSKSFLKAQFKKHTGHGIHQTYLQMKIAFSKKLLSEENRSISEISELLGFSSIHHFSKTFKQVVGMPPSSYVKSVRSRALL